MRFQLLIAALPLFGISSALTVQDEVVNSILSGTVTDGMASPIQGITVWAMTPAGDVQSAKSAEDGTYALVDVPLGTEGLRLWAGSDDYFIKELSVPETPSGEESPVIAMHPTLDPKPRITVRIQNAAGEPGLPALHAHEELKELIFPELQAVATREAPPAMLDLYPYVRIQRRGMGCFRKPRKTVGDRLGTITVDEATDVHVSLVAFQVVLETKVVPTSETEVIFEVAPEDLLQLFGSVRVRFLTGPESDPAPGKGAISPSPYSPMGFGDPSTTSDDDGWLTLTKVLPGSRWLHFKPAGFATLSNQPLAVTLSPGDSLDLGTVTLMPPLRFKGVPRDASGQPRRTAMQLFKIAPDGSVGAYTAAVYSSAKLGALDASIHEPAEYMLELSGVQDYENPGGEIWCGGVMRVDLRTQQQDPLPLLVQRGTLVRVLSPTLAGGLYTGFNYRFTDADGHLRHPAYTQGSYAMVPGRYTVELTRDGEAFASQAITVAEDPLVVVFESDGLPR